MTQINIRVDNDLKANSEALFKRLGLSMSGAITLFLHQALNHQGLPFDVRDVTLRQVSSRSAILDDLREASRFARASDVRLTHDEVFDGVQELIDAGRAVHA